jgi:hypothetical protein
LNSIGGNLGEASRLAQLVRDGNLSTAVAEGDSCASACFLVFAAGAAKFAEHGARIGVHGASDPSGKETIESGAATVLLARAIRELGVPAAIIGKMVVTRPNEVVWLTPDELRSMGATMVGKPALPPCQQVARLPRAMGPSSGAGPPRTW